MSKIVEIFNGDQHVPVDFSTKVCWKTPAEESVLISPSGVNVMMSGQNYSNNHLGYETVLDYSDLGKIETLEDLAIALLNEYSLLHHQRSTVNLDELDVRFMEIFATAFDWNGRESSFIVYRLSNDDRPRNKCALHS